MITVPESFRPQDPRFLDLVEIFNNLESAMHMHKLRFGGTANYLGDQVLLHNCEQYLKARGLL